MCLGRCVWIYTQNDIQHWIQSHEALSICHHHPGWWWWLRNITYVRECPGMPSPKQRGLQVGGERPMPTSYPEKQWFLPHSLSHLCPAFPTRSAIDSNPDSLWSRAPFLWKPLRTGILLCLAGMKKVCLGPLQHFLQWYLGNHSWRMVQKSLFPPPFLELNNSQRDYRWTSGSEPVRVYLKSETNHASPHLSFIDPWGINSPVFFPNKLWQDAEICRLWGQSMHHISWDTRGCRVCHAPVHTVACV